MNERLALKINKLEQYIAIIDRLAPSCDEKFETDDIYRGALLHYLYLMADTCIAIAEIIIRIRKLRTPQTYHDAFDILGENNILDAKFAYEFAKIAGFRNFLAHDYEEIKAKIICREILKQRGDVDEFLSRVKGI